MKDLSLYNKRPRSKAGGYQRTQQAAGNRPRRDLTAWPASQTIYCWCLRLD